MSELIIGMISCLLLPRIMKKPSSKYIRTNSSVEKSDDVSSSLLLMMELMNMTARRGPAGESIGTP
jgi:hypothetical protein